VSDKPTMKNIDAEGGGLSVKGNAFFLYQIKKPTISGRLIYNRINLLC